jgi:hypothetical protein
MLNAPEGALQPASVHEGTCANLDADAKFPLETVTNNRSTSTVKASLADLTNEKFAIAVYKSDGDKTVISCGNMPSAAVVSGQAMTMDQVLTQLLDQANELQGTIKKKEVDASQNAYDAWHSTFAAHENDIKAKDAESQTKLEDAMHGVRDALQESNWDEATEAADKLIETVKEAQGKIGGAASGEQASTTGTMSMETALSTLESQTADLVRETTNKDKEGAQRAYDDFHTTFAANEEAIKAKNANAQAEIENFMHEVRDALQAGDMEKAAEASKELQNAVKEADALIMGAATTSGESTTAGSGAGSGNSSLPTSGNPDFLTVAGLLSLAAALVVTMGTLLRRRAAR